MLNIFKLRFPSGIHFGERSLDETNLSLPADSLFSALYIEAMDQGMDKWLLDKTVSGRLKISDLFPYSKETEYIPKPAVSPVSRAFGTGTARKAAKQLQYIPFGSIGSYINGTMNYDKIAEDFSGLGIYTEQTKNRTNEDEDTDPYNVGIFNFSEGCGLYFFLYTEDEDDVYEIVDILEGLSYTGLGGRKSVGTGCFEVVKQRKVEFAAGDRYMTLSISLPSQEEKDVMENSECAFIKRSGFAEGYKKQDIYMVRAGSVFRKEYEGALYDVSGKQIKHPVYRYGKPIFMPFKGGDYEGV